MWEATRIPLMVYIYVVRFGNTVFCEAYGLCTAPEFLIETDSSLALPKANTVKTLAMLPPAYRM